MNLIWRIVLAGALLMAHFGVWLAIYNRLNSTGMPRKVNKTLGKLAFAFTIVVAGLFAWLMFQNQCRFDSIPTIAKIYFGLTAAAGIWFFGRWIAARPGIERTEIAARRTITVINCVDQLDVSLPRTRKARVLAKIPINQMLQLSVERIELPVAGLPASLDGYRIAHLSDIHFTGHLDPAMTRLAIEHAQAFAPEMVALTGDIVDKQAYYDWLPTSFGNVTATDGCYFILGNHDLRVPDPGVTRRMMTELGWHDLGGRSLPTTLRDVDVELIGNESPWFPRPSIANRSERLRMLLSHSPDQIDWARRHGVRLMLAGHTHGGQGRLPWLGPLIAPSRHGSRFAGGEFYLPPTTLHVTRGIASTQLLRIRCRPQLSLLTLRPVG